MLHNERSEKMNGEVGARRATLRRALLPAAVAAIVAGGALAGCGSSSDSSSGSGGSSGFSNGGKQDAATTSQGVDAKAKTIKVGAFTAKTGQYRVYYEGTEGAIAYFDYINSQGGAGGWKFNYVTRDDAYDPGKTPAVVRQLGEQDKVFSLVSALGTPSNAAAIPYVKQTGLPDVAPAATADTFTSFNKTIFPLVPSFASEAQMLTNYAIKSLHKKKIAILYENDALGQPGDKGAKAALTAAGMKPVANIGYAPTEVDFASYASKLKSSGADAVIAWAGTPAITSVQKASKASGYNPTWLAASFNAQPVFYSLGGLPGTYFDAWLLPVPATNPEFATFAKSIKQYAPSAKPGIAELAGWEEAKVFVHAIQLMAQQSKSMTWKNLVDTLNTYDNYGDDIISGVTYTPTSHLGVTKEGVVKANGKDFTIVAKDQDLEQVK